MIALANSPVRHNPVLRLPPRPRITIRGLSGPKRKRRAVAWRYFAAFLLAASYLLFCHGCHGDEDNDLFSASLNYLNPFDRRAGGAFDSFLSVPWGTGNTPPTPSETEL
jgi:hypothetical protein